MSTTAPPDKSLFFYGSIYHRLLDPQIADERRVAVDLVPQRASVLDIGCGTGQLCRELHEKKQCRVVGVDLSRRMLEFASRADTTREIAFLHADAARLEGIGDGEFDRATIVLLVHELPLRERLLVLSEALRVAACALVIDAATPLPYNPAGMGIRAVESTIGHSHYAHFKDFLARGGVLGLVAACRQAGDVRRREVFWHGCREAVLVGRAA